MRVVFNYSDCSELFDNKHSLAGVSVLQRPGESFYNQRPGVTASVMGREAQTRAGVFTFSVKGKFRLIS